MKSALSLILLFCVPASAAEADAVAAHVRKRFNIPKEVGVKAGNVGPSKIDGWRQGTLELTSPRGTSKQTFLLSNDGRHYYLTPILEPAAVQSGAPGLRLFTGPDAAPVYASEDGKFLLPGAFGSKPEDLTVDPDKDNLAKMNLSRGIDRGPKNAPVALVEYSDMQCPFCRAAHEEIEAKLAAKYGKKVRWVSKHYPLDIHDWARAAALAVVCAGKAKPEAAHKMQSAFFKEQAAIKAADIKAKSLQFAKQAGLPEKAFAACLDSKEAEADVDADKAEGDALGVSSTPTFFINGRKTGFHNFDQLSSAIDEFLK